MLPGARYVSMLLRGGFLLALIIGFGFWFGWWTPSGAIVLIHMLLGLIVIGSVWYLGLAQAQRGGGSLGLTIGTFVVGLLLAIVGLTQERLFGSLPMVAVQITHLLLAVLAVGLGEMCVRRIRGAGPAAAPATRSRG
jgi:hypothetical protein